MTVCCVLSCHDIILSVSARFCHFLFVSVRYIPFLSVIFRLLPLFCCFLSDLVGLCPFLFISVCFLSVSCSLLSVYVIFCPFSPFTSVLVCFSPFLSVSVWFGIFWYWCCYPNMLRYSVSPVCVFLQHYPVTSGRFQDLCEFVEMAAFEDATYLWPQYTLVLKYFYRFWMSMP